MLYFMFYGLSNLAVGGGRTYKSPERRLIAAKRFQKKRSRGEGIFFLDVDETAKPGSRTNAWQFSGKVDLRGAMATLRLHHDYLVPGYMASIMAPSKLAQRVLGL